MISIDALPDDVLLPIFEYYLHEQFWSKEGWTRAWQSLVHVCRRWRSVVFGSPRRLDLQLCCTDRTRSRDLLDIWPVLPLIIKGSWYGFEGFPAESVTVDNIVAALKCSDRVRHIELRAEKLVNWGMLFAAMQQPSPELTNLSLWSKDETVVAPDSFLGGFAPRLRVIDLTRIPFPGLPKLLLSATHLVQLHLYGIPHSGYFSPDAMIAALSNLTNLEVLWLIFESPESCPDLETRRLPPSTRSVLPILKYFEFKGVFEYLEDLVTDIDAPRLESLEITFFNDIVFDMPHMCQFISRTPLSSATNAYITLKNDTLRVSFESKSHYYGKLKVSVLCEGLDWQISSLAQVCTSCLPFLSTLKDLYIHEHANSKPDRKRGKDNIDDGVWLELLHPFIATKNLYISTIVGRRIGPALLKSRAAEVLPTLENIFLESSGRVQKGIGKFVAARRPSSHPVTSSRWVNSQQDISIHLHG